MIMKFLIPILAPIVIVPVIITVLVAQPASGQSASPDSLLFQQGMEAMAGEDYERATALFKDILDSDSLHADAHAMLARTYHAQGKRLLAANQSRLAVRHDPENIDYLILRHRIGFINPRPLDRARKRRLLGRILAIDSLNTYANTERGREFALVYLHHKDRRRVTDFVPPSNPLGAGQVALPDGGAVRIQDPFDLQQLESHGYTLLDVSARAREAYPVAVMHLTRALHNDPQYRPAYDLLMALYAFSGETDEMYRWAKTMHSFRPDDPYSHLYLGYSAYKTGRLEQAQHTFHRAIERLPDEERTVFLEVERLMNKAQAKDFASTAPPDRLAYWKERDPRFLSDYNEREIEHYARLVFSYLLFSEPKLDLKGWDSERGEIYVRYGAPKSMFYMTHSVENCGASGSDFSSGVGVNNITNFQVFEYGGYRIVFGNTGNAGNVANQSSASNVAIPPLNEYVIYSPCASMYAVRSTLGADLDYVLRTKSLIRDTPSDYTLSGNVISFPHLVTSFKGDDAHSDLVIAYGIPVSESRIRSGNEARNTLSINTEFGAFLVSEERGVEEQSRYTVQDVYTDELLPFEGNTLWPGSHLIQAAPGSYTLSVEFETDRATAVGAEKSEVVIPDFEGQDVLMSDIMLAYFVEEHAEGASPSGVIRRKGLDITAAPWALYEEGRPVYFYFEMYNLSRAAGGEARYEVEALLVEAKDAQERSRRLFRRARRNNQGVAVRFENVTNERDSGLYLIMDTEDLSAGDYVLLVRVTDTEAGQEAERRRTIYLR